MTTRLDRYAACCVNLVLPVTRRAVQGARSAPRDTGNQPISKGAAPWLVRLVALCGVTTLPAKNGNPLGFIKALGENQQN